MGQFKTPLRYPGGKQRLTPFITEILEANEITGHYVEPYAGGAGVAIELLVSRKINNVHLNDSHLGIYAFWHTLINSAEELCRKISSASMTVEEWRKQQQIVKNPVDHSLFDLGFAIFFLNRVNRSGVLSGGVIGGLNQTGNYKMDARFNRNDLIRRIELISLFSDRIHISNMDGENYIDNYIPNLPADTLIYLDPPYYNKASELYLNSYKKSDHADLAIAIQNRINHPWILSYDGVPEILSLYNERRHFLYDLQYSAATVQKGKEVFIFDDNLTLPQQCSLPHVNIGLQCLL